VKDKKFMEGMFGSKTADGAMAMILCIQKPHMARAYLQEIPNNAIFQCLPRTESNKDRLMLRMELFRRLEIGDTVFAFGELTKVIKLHKAGNCIWVENCKQVTCVNDILFLHEIENKATKRSRIKAGGCNF